MGFKFKWKYLFVILCLFLVFKIHLDFHKGYNYPLISDEWTLFAQASRLSEGANIEEEGTNSKYISAIIIPTAFLYKIGINAAWHDEKLASFLTALSALCVYLLLRKRFGEIAGFAGMLFFAGLPSNLNILGTAFFIPLTAAMPFVYLAINLFEKPVTLKNTALFAIAWILIGAIHPLSFIYSTIAFFIALTARLHDANKKIGIFLGVLGILIAGMLLKTFPFLIFPKTYVYYIVGFNFVLLYGLLSFILAFIGMFFAWKKCRTLVLWAVFGFLMIWVYELFGFSLFVSRERVIYLLMVGLVPLSAVGFAYIFNKLWKLNVKNHLGKISALVFLIACILFLAMNRMQIPDQRLHPSPQFGTQYELKSLEKMTNFTGRMLVPMELSLPAQAITGNPTVSCAYYYVCLNNSGYEDLIRTNLTKTFYSGNCDEQRLALKRMSRMFDGKYRPDYLLYYGNLSCQWQYTAVKSMRLVNVDWGDREPIRYYNITGLTEYFANMT